MINILTLFTTIYLFALIDSEHFKRHQFFKDHKSRFILRSLFVLVLGQLNIKITVGAALLFYALFDAVLNSLMDWGILHIGDTSKIDRFFKSPFRIAWFKGGKIILKPITKSKRGLYKAMKFACLLGGLALMII